jgi:hypothetical protein
MSISSTRSCLHVIQGMRSECQKINLEIIQMIELSCPSPDSLRKSLALATWITFVVYFCDGFHRVIKSKFQRLKHVDFFRRWIWTKQDNYIRIFPALIYYCFAARELRVVETWNKFYWNGICWNLCGDRVCRKRVTFNLSHIQHLFQHHHSTAPPHHIATLSNF